MGDKLPFNKKITSAVAAPFVGLAIVLLASIAGVGGVALLGLGVAVIVAFGLVSYLMMQAAITQVSSLAVQVADIASEQLPDYVAEATAAKVDGAQRSVQEIGASGDPDLDQLADAINRITYAAKGTADNYGALLQRGIGDVFVDLARRNQTLLREQMSFIEKLESDERDPDRLESLFTLDHMTTQMQRNSDSILVLADSDLRQVAAGTVALHDVVRAAQGEIAEFNRVTVQSTDDVAVEASTGIDLAHLLAELLENATEHSPATTDVEVSGRKTEHGFVLVVRDHGPGMRPEQISEVNALLAEPAPVGLATSRWVGFNVVSRLAARLDTKVAVNSSDGDEGGLTITVTLPQNLLVSVSAAAATASGAGWLKPADTQAPAAAPPRLHPVEPVAVQQPLEPIEANTDPAAAPMSIFADAPVDPAPVMDPAPVIESAPVIEPVAEADAFMAPMTLDATPTPVAEPAPIAEPQVAQPFPEPAAQVAPVAEPAAPIEPAPLPARQEIATPEPAANPLTHLRRRAGRPG